MDPSHKYDIATAPKRTSKHWKPGSVTWAELVHWVENPSVGPEKETGSYVLGKLVPTPACPSCAKAGKDECLTRNNRSIVSRWALTLDSDNPGPDFLQDVELALLGHAYLLHTTHSSAPDAPRYRIIVPAAREMNREEFAHMSQDLMQRIGIRNFDVTCDEPERFMFRPAAQEEDWYVKEVHDGEPLPVKITTDLSQQAFPKPHRNKRNPFELPGVIGEFNRAYEGDLDGLIAQYHLPYVSAGADRWQMADAVAQAGMGEVDGSPGLYFSHHAHDPAHGRACSAFDLVRIHEYGHEDDIAAPGTPLNKLPSYERMLDTAAQDPRILRAQFDELDDDEKWKMDLTRSTRTQAVQPTVQNLNLIQSNDPVFTGLRYHVLRMVVETVRDLPWRRMDEQGGPVFGDNDEAHLSWYLEESYGLKLPEREIERRVKAAAKNQWHNPVEEYLSSLSWDGVSRVETCLPGVRPSPYTRLVARKSLVAAVARMLEPGVKWDHTMVLVGKQGIGKTYWVQKMSRGWTAPLGRLDDKDTLMTLQRSWIVTSDEAHTLRKAESEAQKEFLTRTFDVFRAPYDRTMQEYKRHCVIWGTTNDQVFLRDQEGNRRFLVVRCESRLDFDTMTDEYVDQLWAEAVRLYREGERLYLTDEESALATEEVAQHVEEDSLYGIVQEYLDKPISDFEDEDGGDVPRRNMVCTRELWDHALGNMNPPKRTDLIELGTVLLKIPGWYRLPGLKKVPNYGPQRVFVRIGSSEDPAADLL